jgi:hypothetical protein
MLLPYAALDYAALDYAAFVYAAFVYMNLTCSQTLRALMSDK